MRASTVILIVMTVVIVLLLILMFYVTVINPQNGITPLLVSAFGINTLVTGEIIYTGTVTRNTPIFQENITVHQDTILDILVKANNSGVLQIYDSTFDSWGALNGGKPIPSNTYVELYYAIKKGSSFNLQYSANSFLDIRIRLKRWV